MIAHRQLPSRAWMLIVTVVLLFSVHGLVFYLLRHLALSGAVISGLIILILIQHLGAFRSLYDLVHRQAINPKTLRHVESGDADSGAAVYKSTGDSDEASEPILK